MTVSKNSLFISEIILSKSNNCRVFCKNKKRNSLEISKKYKEKEKILSVVKRKLTEETIATIYKIEPVCVYSGHRKKRINETVGILYFAEIKKFKKTVEKRNQKIYLLGE
ncbi:MAG: hypothetical protein KH354_01570 [Clostridiales bacterium]|nr:hypothetical protein [Clostridiales bacterium]